VGLSDQTPEVRLDRTGGFGGVHNDADLNIWLF
jgi:hypothetical protein